MSAIRPALRAGLVLLLTAAPAAAQGTNALATSYDGTNTFAGTLSQEFTVGAAPVRITRFGAFDASTPGGQGVRDGFAGTITVQLFQLLQRGAVPSQDVVAAYGSALTFSGTQGTLDGAFRYQALAAPLELPAGFVGRIGAWGFVGADRYFNAFDVSQSGFARMTTDGGGLLDFGSVYYAEAPGGVPTLRSGDGSPGWYGAASFTFEAGRAAVVTPEPGTWALLGTGLVAIAGIAARRRRAG
ncbi:PEP-CTERM sorting domain-containing protein [Roseisolibacter agri]|uniref:Ice-binding protein C-terminal domain-containing protein n=1 Tax=Roseisolibacter agri TaxID=2014610 RepID=A0AA37VDU6_9BACT|nr:PEP-CTERM sorting domain-containing protein [Roseisolibacter agri]GLC24209.1 hypothetical protein rosag_07220 [Roseisolibacter agri]